METEILAGLLALVASGGLPAAAARFLRRRRLTEDEDQRAGTPHVSAEATLAEAAEIAHDDRSDEITAVQHNEAVGTLHVKPTVPDVTFRVSRQRRFDIAFADAIYGIAMILGIAAKAVWDYENQYHKVGVDWLQINLALLVAPIVYIGVSSTLQSSSLSGKVGLPGLALAFQNGFFWQTVFSTLQESNATKLA